MDTATRATGLAADELCTVDFEVGDGILDLGASPFGQRRVGVITGGAFDGPRLRGVVLPGGSNWPVMGRLGDATVGTLDARAVWRTADGALIAVAYTGRSVVPDDVRAEFADPARAGAVDPARYYLRIAVTFETADPRYAWLNGIVAIGVGERTTTGARHRLFEIR